ncbi:hypothetical protein RFI_05753 [Reticulomyxa filosa]|uniref:Uncharacterized protein n=1 Tax=Reticulomyxa filosa TaxID=46433 RepID=X6P1F3_RETFI|nr:hypothetical protein RFI_05753 [Reticulomyxa filosa]|eukprot:ETO31367.1 hypothetical protein RFI_05753 [Reticulomyxa filosa]
MFVLLINRNSSSNTLSIFVYVFYLFIFFTIKKQINGFELLKYFVCFLKKYNYNFFVYAHMYPVQRKKEIKKNVVIKKIDVIIIKKISIIKRKMCLKKRNILIRRKRIRKKIKWKKINERKKRIITIRKKKRIRMKNCNINIVFNFYPICEEIATTIKFSILDFVV